MGTATVSSNNTDVKTPFYILDLTAETSPVLFSYTKTDIITASDATSTTVANKPGSLSLTQLGSGAGATGYVVPIPGTPYLAIGTTKSSHVVLVDAATMTVFKELFSPSTSDLLEGKPSVDRNSNILLKWTNGKGTGFTLYNSQGISFGGSGAPGAALASNSPVVVASGGTTSPTSAVAGDGLRFFDDGLAFFPHKSDVLWRGEDDKLIGLEPHQ
jgi:hypothetical protein